MIATESAIRTEIVAIIAGILQSKGFHFNWGTVNEFHNVKLPSAVMGLPEAKYTAINVGTTSFKVDLVYTVELEAVTVGATGDDNPAYNHHALSAAAEDVVRALLLHGQLTASGRKVIPVKSGFESRDDGDAYSTGVYVLRIATSYEFKIDDFIDGYDPLTIITAYEIEPERVLIDGDTLKGTI